MMAATVKRHQQLLTALALTAQPSLRLALVLLALACF